MSFCYYMGGYRVQEDGAKVVTVENLNNPYRNQANFERRFKLSLNKLYAWSLVDYERVVMLDADNLFLRNTDELFQCGQFCAVFINPCIFHTGLFVLQVRVTTCHHTYQTYTMLFIMTPFLRLHVLLFLVLLLHCHCPVSIQFIVL